MSGLRTNILKGTTFLATSICLVLLTFSSIQARDSLSLVNNLRLGGYVKHGTLLPHHSSIAYAMHSNISGLEVLLSTDTYGRSAWDSLYRFPRIGIGYNYSTLGNSEVFGSGHSFFGFVDVPFIRNPGKFNVYYQFTVGIAYLTRTYDVVDNPLNVAISSGLNLYGNLKFTARYSFNRQNEITAGFGLTHYSNGKMGTPNLGLNSFNLALGYFHEIKGGNQPHRISRDFPAISKHSGDLVISAGVKVDDQATSSKYLISTLVADYIFSPGPKYAFGLGTDLFYDQSLGPNVAEKEGESYTQKDLLQFGMHLGVYAHYGRIRITGHIGTYLVAKYYKYAKVYTRIGMRYSVSNRVFLNIALKAHYAIADYVEWGIGYRIK
jgi:hypothetical protein